MAELPTGTVTFLFTDIAGSTRLWEQHPQAMEAALGRHDALAAEMVAGHSGTLIKHRGEGDSLFAVFARATDAVAAACSLQQALAGEPWPVETPLRVRAALHTGEAALRDADYYGPAINRCARLRAVAHGGQVLLSLATEQLVRDHLPVNAGLRDLGEHRLRDLARPERIFQLLHPDLPSDFPPLVSLDALPNNLPQQVTSFIGREKEMADIRALLNRTRLLTLTGSGGTGKTRLSLQVAADLLEGVGDGVWLVELAPLADPALVPQAVTTALGVREEPGKPLTQTLVEFLKPKKLVLLLDNCEHLLSACAQLVEALLRGCPEVQILASSREGLNISGETTYRLPSLSLPDPKEWLMVDGSWLMADSQSCPHRPATINHEPSTILQYEAVRLFIDRAVAALPSFTVTDQNAPAVAEICCRLDGIPLAIELAAARVRVLQVEEIAARLDDRFRLLTGGSRTALPRQQTLRALIDWSYDLLAEPERALLRWLSVFAGGWTLQAAEAVCGDEGVRRWALGVRCSTPDLTPNAQRLTPPLEESEVLDLLTALVDKSLVVVAEGAEGGSRYRLLETVRQYARDRLLESGEGEAVRDRHCKFFLQMAEEAETQIRGPEQLRWLRTLEGEHDNLRAACEWALAADAEVACRLAAALWWFWYYRTHGREGRQRLEAALAQATPVQSSVPRARALVGLSALTYFLGDSAALAAQVEECVATARATGDKPSLAFALCHATVQALAEGNDAQAAAAAEASRTVAAEVGDPWFLATAHMVSGFVPIVQGDYERARAFLSAGVTLAGQTGDRWLMAATLANLGWMVRLLGEHEEARAISERAIRQMYELGESAFIAPFLEEFAALEGARQQPERAARLYGAAEALREAFGHPIEALIRPFYDRDVAAARAQLDDAAFAAAWAEGRELTLDEAVRLALQE